MNKILYAVFFENWRKKVGTCLLMVLFVGCVKNDLRLQSKEDHYISADSTNVSEKVAYLTFDDGPSKVTEMVLDELKEEKVKATFFLIGEQITKEKEPLLQRMVKEGHLIGVHTYTHRWKDIYASANAYIEDAEKTAERIYEVTGVKPIYYRFPWGSVNGYISSFCDDIIKRMKEKGYTYFDWNVSAEDSVGKPTQESILKNVRKDYKRYQEPVILMHDSPSNRLTAETLVQIIREMKDEGYGFSTIQNRSKPCQY
ncbi:MAG: polysaccharide deacetylase family protein [Acetivibrio sp.]